MPTPQGNTGQLFPFTTNWVSRARSDDGDNGVGPAAGGGGGEDSSVQTAVGFDDSSWDVVDLPHDGSIERAYTRSAAHGEAFIPNAQNIYRKHFKLPSSFRGKAITLEVDGALTSSSWWVNGVQVVGLKTDGYLPLTLRLDALPGVTLNYTTDLDVDVDSGSSNSNSGGESGGSDGGENVIAVWTDNSASTGWWYEGSGLARHARLIVAPHAAQLLPFAVAVPSVVVKASVKPLGARPLDGLVGVAAVFPSADVHVAQANTRVTAAFTLSYATANGSTVVAGQTRVTQTIPAGGAGGDTTMNAPPIHLETAQLWSVARPFLYTMVTTLTAAVIGTNEARSSSSTTSTNANTSTNITTTSSEAVAGKVDESRTADPQTIRYSTEGVFVLF